MNTLQFENFLTKLNTKSIPVIDASIPFTKYVKIDLSINNKNLQDFNVDSATEWEQYINLYLYQNNAKVAFGGYLEKRLIYNRSNHFNALNKNKRDIHLGVDFWCKENTQVLAALNGEIYSFKNNTNFGDYGPTIILKHEIKTVIFYTLYGHLSMQSIKGLSVGQQVKQGQVIGALGDVEVNGNYAPHLHFQIIKDIQDYKGDYPGVCNYKHLEFYKRNCPNPLLLLMNFYD